MAETGDLAYAPILVDFLRMQIYYEGRATYSTYLDQLVGDEALALIADPTERLPRLPSRASYWFGWYSFHPDTQVYAGLAGAP